MLLARLKPYNGKQFTLRSYTVFGIKFVGDRGWYKVDDDVGEYLKTIVQRDSDPDSAPAFDVCTEAQAKAIEEAEKKKAFTRVVAEAEEVSSPMRVHNVRRPEAAKAAKAAIESNDLTTADLAHASPKSELEEALHPSGLPEEEPDLAPNLSGDFDEDMAATTVDKPKADPKSSTPPKGGSKKKAPDLL